MGTELSWAECAGALLRGREHESGAWGVDVTDENSEVLWGYPADSMFQPYREAEDIARLHFEAG